MHPSTRLIRVKLLAIAFCSLLTTAHGQQTTGSASKLLIGSFALQATEHCLHSSAFGPPPVLEALGPTTAENITIQGTLTFRGDGTGELLARMSSLASPESAPPVHQSTLRCPVTYALERNGSIELQRTCTGTVTRGTGSVGAQVWSMSTVKLVGHFARNTGSLQLTDTELAIETITSFRGARTPRLCNRSWLATRIDRAN